MAWTFKHSVSAPCRHQTENIRQRSETWRNRIIMLSRVLGYKRKCQEITGNVSHKTQNRVPQGVLVRSRPGAPSPFGWHCCPRVFRVACSTKFHRVRQWDSFVPGLARHHQVRDISGKPLPICFFGCRARPFSDQTSRRSPCAWARSLRSRQRWSRRPRAGHSARDACQSSVLIWRRHYQTTERASRCTRITANEGPSCWRENSADL